MSQKQVMDMRSTTEGISTQESNEQQRNWSDEHWQKKAKDSLANYDPTRGHLNFEVVKGGIIQPIDTSKTIMQKMTENLATRGIKDPNARENVRRAQRTLAQFILSGSHDRMVELAFGNQDLNLKKGADNSGLVRQKDIENWAKDVYNFMAKRFGEENIISFYVHLDEKSPHVHCTVVPVNDHNRISWKSVFGDGREAESKNMTKLHDALEEEVNQKWGLDRGSNMAETKAKHRSTEEYKRDLVREVDGLQHTIKGLNEQIRRAEIKLKGISTMIQNLEQRKEDIDREIELLAEKFGEDSTDTAIIAESMRKLRAEKDSINETLLKRYQQLEDAKKAISNAKAELLELEAKKITAKNDVVDKISQEAVYVQTGICSTYSKMISDSFKPVLPSLPVECQKELENLGFFDLTDNGVNILNCALMLAVDYVREATTYAQDCGGGGSNMSGWGRKKDDDDERWWMRCISKAASMVKSGNRSSRKR